MCVGGGGGPGSPEIFLQLCSNSLILGALCHENSLVKIMKSAMNRTRIKAKNAKVMCHVFSMVLAFSNHSRKIL